MELLLVAGGVLLHLCFKGIDAPSNIDVNSDDMA